MKALNFIRFNRGDFEDETKVPRRVYYCKACMGWHITSRPLNKPEWLVNMEIDVERCENWLKEWNDVTALNFECKRLLHKIGERQKELAVSRILDDFRQRLERIVYIIYYVKERIKKINRLLVDLESYLKSNLFASAYAMLREVEYVCEDVLCNSNCELIFLKSFFDSIIEKYTLMIEGRMPVI